MKIGRLDVSAWTYQGRPLAKPHVIARRAIALPLLWLGKALIFIGALLGWGLDDATDTWEQLP